MSQSMTWRSVRFYSSWENRGKRRRSSQLLARRSRANWRGWKTWSMIKRKKRSKRSERTSLGITMAWMEILWHRTQISRYLIHSKTLRTALSAAHQYHLPQGLATTIRWWTLLREAAPLVQRQTPRRASSAQWVTTKTQRWFSCTSLKLRTKCCL